MTLDSPVAGSEVHYYPDCPPHQLCEVIAMLDRWSQRAENHASLGRRHRRHPLQSALTLELRERLPPALAAQVSAPRVVFHLTARNVSLSGLGVVAPPMFSARLLSDGTPPLRTEQVLRPGTRLRIALGESLQVHGAVVRLRPVHQGFFEAGIVFDGKV